MAGLPTALRPDAGDRPSPMSLLALETRALCASMNGRIGRGISSGGRPRAGPGRHRRARAPAAATEAGWSWSRRGVEAVRPPLRLSSPRELTVSCAELAGGARRGGRSALVRRAERAGRAQRAGRWQPCLGAILASSTLDAQQASARSSAHPHTSPASDPAHATPTLARRCGRCTGGASALDSRGQGVPDQAGPPRAQGCGQ